MPSFSKAATYLMYSSVMDDEDATFKSRLSPEDRRRRDRRIPRRANLSYYEDSPFKNIFDSGDDQALLNLTGLDHHTFSKLLGIYQPHYSCFTWCRIFKSVRRLKICSRRRRMLDATGSLGLVLTWFRTKGSCTRNLQLIFGLTGTPMYTWLKFGRRVLLFALQKVDSAKISAPSVQELHIYMSAVAAKYPRMNVVWGAMDGLKLTFQKANNGIKQNHFYNGWTHGHYISYEILTRGNNGQGGAVHHIRMDQPKNVSHDCVRVLYPGSSELSTFENCGLDKVALLDYVLTRGKFKKKSRDSGFARRVTMGWTRKQASKHPKTKYHQGIQLPLMNIQAIESMPVSLRISLGKILLNANKTLVELFSDKNPLPFSNKKRNSIYGHTFTSHFCKKYASSWEFVDLFVESGGNLNRHMDYQNSGRSGYDYGASYSYLIEKDGIQYRVNIIMCARKSVDQSIDELERNGK